ncbi:MAG: gamma-glutamylcyclotransferase [Candidatus Hydrogenedentes bacterium]|nr:gamma-glutamylcyclotransferase [Candidatus Hydrogenedentota bacterium]
MKSACLFAYGTLRRDSHSPMHGYLAEHAEWLGYATFQGRMYLVDYYPGVVPSQDPADVVRGEVYRLRDAEESLPRIDHYEACTSGPESEYRRQTCTVCLDGGQTMEAWIYVFQQSTEGLTPIAGGDFIRFTSR